MRKRIKFRVTFFSGDVHCCGVSRFRTRQAQSLSPNEDPKLMYQIISSAIVNKPPPKKFIQAAHLFGTKWYLKNNTEEHLIDFFERAPKNGKLLFLRKLLPNRNWCFFEQCGEPTSAVPAPADRGFLQNVWFHILLLISFLGFGGFLGWDKEEERNTEIGEPLTRQTSYQNIETNEEQRDANYIKVRFWLESVEKDKNVPNFASYDLIIPNLE